MTFAALLFALDPPRWLPDGLFWPILAGFGAMIVVLLPLALARKFRRPRARPAPRPVVCLGPEYDPFVLGSSSEKRGAWRRRGNSVRVLVRGPGCETDPLLGWVVDRSPTGVGVLVSREFANGTQLSVLPETGSDVAPWLEVTVCSSERQPDGWHLGCKFLHAPQWNVLLLFG
jgi:hypothetical protein